MRTASMRTASMRNASMRNAWMLLCALLAVPSLHGQLTSSVRDYSALTSKKLAVKDRLGGLECHPSFMPSDSFTPDGKTAVYLGNNLFGEPVLELTIWDVERGQVKHSLQFNQLESGALALSADGKHALVNAYQFADKDKPEPRHHLYVVEVASGKIVRQFDSAIEAKKLTDLGNPHVYLAWLGDDGKTALTMQAGGTLARWDLEQKKLLGNWKFNDNPSLLGERVFLPKSGKLLRTHKGRIGIIDTTTGKESAGHAYQNIDPKDVIVHGVFSGDERRLASTWVNGDVRVLDIANGKLLDSVSFPAQEIQRSGSNQPTIALAFADGGDTVLGVIPQFDPQTGHSKPATLFLRDVKAKKTLWTKSAPVLTGIVPIAVVEGGKKAIVGGGPNPFVRVNLADGAVESIWGGHKGSVLGLAALPKGLHTFGQEGSGIRWDADNKSNAGFIASDPKGFNACAVSADGKILLTASGPALVQRDPNTGAVTKKLGEHDAGITSIALAPDGDWAVSAGSDRVMKTWDLKTGMLINIYPGSPGAIHAVVVTPDGKTLISGGDDGTIRFWQVRGTAVDAVRKTFVLAAHPRAVTSLALSADGKSLLSGSQDKTVKLCDVESRKLLKTLTGHTNWVTSVTFLGDEYALSTSDDLTLRLWNLKTGMEDDKLDLGAVSDVPRCVIALSPTSWALGTTNWLVLKGELKK